MIRNIRKVITVLLCASLLASTCSCAGSTQEHVVASVDHFAKLVIHRMYDELEELSTSGDEDLREMMALSSDSLDLNEQARVFVMDTMTYEIDEDSFKGGAMYRTNTIDVTFEYVDFEKLENSDFYADIDEFKEDVQNCSETVKKTVTLEFVSEDDDYLCSNLGDLTSVFQPIYNAQFNFPDTYASYVSEVRFTGEGYDEVTNTYTDAGVIECEVGITGDGTLMDWYYGVSVSRDGEELYHYDNYFASAPTMIDADYEATGNENLPEGSYLPDGEYEFVFYDSDGTHFASATTNVTHTEVTPTPTPTQVPEPDVELGVFFCPEGDSVTLPGTDVVYTLPEDSYMQFREEDYQSLSYIMEQGNPDHLVLFADVNEYDIRDFRAYYIPDAGVDSQEANDALQYFVDNTASYYNEGEYNITETTVEMNGRSFRAIYFENLQSGLDGYDRVFVLVGNENVSYVVVFYEDNMDYLEEDIAAWAAENSSGGDEANTADPIL